MLQRIYAYSALTLLVSLNFHVRLAAAAPLPMPQNEIDDYGGGMSTAMTHNPTGFDYNSVMGHFKDFVMYLPVMMTTLKETMTGFPKFAEGIRILTSKTGRIEGSEDCKCKDGGGSNEIDNNSRYG